MEIEILKDYNISNLLSMGIGGCVSNFATAYTEDDIKVLHLLSIREGLPLIILGGGSNLIISDTRTNCLMVAIRLKGITETHRDSKNVYLCVSAGEDWDGFVRFTIENNYWGCENLSLIPGLVGATPVQNVGAFGQEVRHIIQSVRCYDRLSKDFIEIENNECDFKFRSSIFNCKFKHRFVICSVNFKLSLYPKPLLKRKEFTDLRSISKSSPNLQANIRERVISYRTNGKNLPVGPQFGSSGTFFRTGLIKDKITFIKVLLRTLTQLGPKAALMIILFAIKYRTPEGYKLPSKFLIMLCGLSSLKVGSLSLLHSNPACVVSHLSDLPLAVDLVELINIVRREVFNKTGIVLPIEPEMLGFSLEIPQSLPRGI